MKSSSKVFKALEFAAYRHSNQTRKGTNKIPYINHPISVIRTLSEHNETDPDLLAAAALHDVIEDTARGKAEIEGLSSSIKDHFGEKVLEIVLEVSDDKTLPFQERKHRQIINTPYLSSEAKKLKIADKICNIQDLLKDPPDDWPMDRKTGYIEWARKVIDGARGENQTLENYFDQTARNAYIQLTGETI